MSRVGEMVEGEGKEEQLRLVWEDPDLNYDTLPQPYSFIVELLDDTISDAIDDHDAAKNQSRQNYVDVNDLISVRNDASVIHQETFVQVAAEGDIVLVSDDEGFVHVLHEKSAKFRPFPHRHRLGSLVIADKSVVSDANIRLIVSSGKQCVGLALRMIDEQWGCSKLFSFVMPDVEDDNDKADDDNDLVVTCLQIAPDAKSVLLRTNRHQIAVLNIEAWLDISDIVFSADDVVDDDNVIELDANAVRLRLDDGVEARFLLSSGEGQGVVDAVLCWNPGGHKLCTYEIEQSTPSTTWLMPSKISCVEVDGEGRLVVVGTNSGVVFVFDSRLGTELICLESFSGAVRCATFHSNRFVMIAAQDGVVKVVDIQLRKLVVCTKSFPSAIQQLATSPLMPLGIVCS